MRLEKGTQEGALRSVPGVTERQSFWRGNAGGAGFSFPLVSVEFLGASPAQGVTL